MLALDEAGGGSHDSEREIVVHALSADEDFQNSSRLLIERFYCSIGVSVRQRLGLGQDTFPAVLIDVEPENLPTKLAVHENRRRWSGRISLCRKVQRENAEKKYRDGGVAK